MKWRTKKARFGALSHRRRCYVAMQGWILTTYVQASAIYAGEAGPTFAPIDCYMEHLSMLEVGEGNARGG